MNIKSIKLKLKEIDYRHYVVLGVTLLFCLLGAFVYRNSYIRTIESIRDLVLSIVEYFKFVTGKDVNKDLPLLQSSTITYPLVVAFEEFKLFFIDFGKAFISLDNFKSYLSLVFKVLFLVSTLGGIVVLIGYLMYLIFIKLLYSQNDKKDFEYSWALKVAFRFGEKVYKPVKLWLKGMLRFLLERSYYLKLWFAIWCLNLNVVALCCAFFAYFLYFAVTFNVGSMFFQFYKLILDLSLMIGGLPLILWAVIALFFYVRWSLKLGKRRIQRIEAGCEAFVKSLKSVVVFLVGTMGKGKTKLQTDLALTQRNIFRDKAFEILGNKDLEFPSFPWVKVEKLVLNYMEMGLISKPYDVISVFDKIFLRLGYYKASVKSVERHNRKHGTSIEPLDVLPFGYDFFNKKVAYNNGLYFQDICKVITDYAQAFFIYVCDNLNISNYSIRFDDELKSLGNFPLWDYDFVTKNVENFDYLSRYSHILNFDMMRLTKKMDELKGDGLVTHGVVTITEIGKERGNQLELQGIKKEDKKANQKNDGFNKYLKFCRHLSTICYYPFIKVFVDDQRPESWGADGKDLTQIIKVGDELETRCALPFFKTLDKILNNLLVKFRDFYFRFRFFRSDVTLLSHSLHLLASKVYDFLQYCHNRFDFTPVQLYLLEGNQEGQIISVIYNESKVKTLSDRYSTDCYSPIFNKIRSKGINLMPTYNSNYMTIEEFKYQNSYLFEDLDGISTNKKGGKDGK